MAIQKSTDSSSLAEVIDRILDKGVVIDLYARVSLVGIELITIEARVVIASVDTWLRYAEAVGLLRDEVQGELDGAEEGEGSNRLNFA
ncbi:MULTISPECIES: gas vesicle structural protein GvpA [Alteribacter]|uniref:Gas vesicle protein A n=1 Tax=Alteribacter keqinensis TaxID=2483800 RepID=A0A3M7TTT4_9BACI|nr:MULTISPECIES: gas vesicle structural protein GvpA [Alteribacter]MBM7095647.1 gas vesicle structural protein GvpA [Alteribacter salitolerans]RNA67763.1 gas vesicle structural protein GvpA [Alteribacter keqinensis]